MCWVSEVCKGHHEEKNSLEREVLGKKLKCNDGEGRCIIFGR